MVPGFGCGDDTPELVPASTTASATEVPAAPTGPATIAAATAMPTTRWRWDSGLFNNIIWVRAAEDVVAASYGGLYEGPNNFSPKPGGVALLDAATGNQLWRVSTETQAFPAALIGNLVVVGTGNGTVFALDRATGAERWRLAFDGIPYQVMNGSGVLVVADADPETWGPGGLVDKTRLAGRVWGVDPATGKVLWKASVGSFNAFIATDGRLVAAAAATTQGHGETAVFEAQTGRELWRVPVEASSPPSIRDDLVVVPGTQLRALNAQTGASRWQVAPANGGTFFFPAVVGGNVIAGTNTHTLELFSASNGTRQMLVQTGECGGYWLEVTGETYGLLCGGLVRLEQGPTGAWQIVTVLIPQGSIDSAAPLGKGVVFSSGIGSSPEYVAFIQP